ncbi:MAG: bifunctional hydroxymethylpyrimidine kinase/phosphomethylpyrimidine kinase [Bacteroidales bacterium]|nr:bifunctional hydroxymethylpyrimidine kinase/phosphomethylpyrimidine kinase [Bacteroidales bacterium]
MPTLVPILTITGSDGAGVVGVQADIRTMSALGGYALTAITSVTIQNDDGSKSIDDLPSEMIIGQVRAIVKELHPKVVKVGLVRDVATIKMLKREIVAFQNVVIVPGIFSSEGRQLVSDDAIAAMKKHLLPMATLLILRSNEAEKILDLKIKTDDDMIKAARMFVDMGAESVLLRSSKHTDGLLTALLYENDNTHFFTSHNTEGWQKHGVGGALSSAIATRLAFGDDVATAIDKAHDYMHKQVVYAVTEIIQHSRKTVIYNKLMSLVADNYNKSHDVAFYADKLCISTRYLSQVTNDVVGISPKQIISDYVIKEAKILLQSTNYSIQEISDRLGFSSQSTFSSFFIKYEKCTPTFFRLK